jgi:two-component system, NarL family, invasion response regulator UvrY
MRILIADDHPLMRRGVRTLLEEAIPGMLAGEAEDFDGLIASLQSQPWDMVTMDLTMPGVSGLEGLVRIHRSYPQLPVLVLSMHSEEQYAVRALQAGAMGYLSKEHSFDELIQAVRQVAERRRYVSSRLAERLALELVEGVEKAVHERLSQREYRVLCLIGRGSSVSEIAELLHLSVKTVSTYRTRVLEKMGMKGNADLMRYCIENGLGE